MTPASTASAAQRNTAASGPPRAYLSRRYRLSAAHRLASPAYSEERNREVYGKCANPHGHGHNYVVEVTLGGQVHPQTGMVCDLAELDDFARTNVLDRFDGMNLNMLEEFRNQVSTTENFARRLFTVFEQFAGAELVRLRIEETGNNSFEVGREL